MAIYLDQQTRPYLERLIRNQIIKSDKDFIAKRIMSMLESEEKTIKEMSECEHEFVEYVGSRISCCKCNSFQEERWTKK
jgi:hypothetical protein